MTKTSHHLHRGCHLRWCPSLGVHFSNKHYLFQLREYAKELRDKVAKNVSDEDIQSTIKVQMAVIYNIVATCLGNFNCVAYIVLTAGTRQPRWTRVCWMRGRAKCYRVFSGSSPVCVTVMKRCSRRYVKPHQKSMDGLISDTRLDY